MNMHQWCRRSAFIRFFFSNIPSDTTSQHQWIDLTATGDSLKWVSFEIMNMSLRKTKRLTKRATLSTQTTEITADNCFQVCHCSVNQFVLLCATYRAFPSFQGVFFSISFLFCSWPQYLPSPLCPIFHFVLKFLSFLSTFFCTTLFFHL